MCIDFCLALAWLPVRVSGAVERILDSGIAGFSLVRCPCGWCWCTRGFVSSMDEWDCIWHWYRWGRLELWEGMRECQRVVNIDPNVRILVSKLRIYTHTPTPTPTPRPTPTPTHTHTHRWIHIYPHTYIYTIIDGYTHAL